MVFYRLKLVEKRQYGYALYHVIRELDTVERRIRGIKEDTGSHGSYAHCIGSASEF